jgi:hypothetical protein
VENILLIDTEFTGLLKVVGKNIQEELRVRVGVDVSMSIGIKELSELRGVDEITVLVISAILYQTVSTGFNVLTWAKTIPYGELT